jgi:ribonuclease HI
MLSSWKIDIALIQETHLRTGDAIHKFPGFTVLNQVRKAVVGGPATPSRGGVMILVRDDIPFSRMPSMPRADGVVDALEDLGVSVDIGRVGGRMHFWNVYSPPIRPGPAESRSPGFDPQMLPHDDKVFIGGDFNAHSPLWDQNQPDDAMGRALEQWLAETGMLTLNDGTPTRVNLATGGMSSPDLTVMDSSWAGRAEWRVIDGTGSDHSAIITVLNIRTDCLKNKRRKMRWNWAAADWDSFQDVTEGRFQSIQWDESAGIKECNAQFCRILLEAAEQCVTRVSVAAERRPWMSREVREAMKRRNRLRRTVRENREEWLDACRDVRELVEAARKRKWTEFVESLDSSTDVSKVWGVVRSLSGSSARCGRNEILKHNGRSILSDTGKASAFMSEYARVSNFRIPKEGRCVASDVATRRQIQTPATDEESLFSEVELSDALQSMKGKGAPGGDGICPRFLKNLGGTGRELLLELLNRSWSSGEVPQAWRDATIIPLLKAGKPADRVDSFRPVSLTSCVAKCLERMIANRLQFLSETRGWWSTEQAGFRKFRSCEDQVLRLTQSISDGFQQTKPLRTVLALLDFSKAYDTVWRDLLLQRLLECSVPARYVNWLAGFLRNRRARVSWEGSVCGYYQLKQGLPQGSVLAPLLFLFYINPVVRELPEGVFVSLYADDLALWAQHRQKEEAANLVEAAVQRVADWSIGAKLSLSVAKCEVAFFSSSTHEARHVPRVVVNGMPMRVTESPVFLGVTLDRALTFSRHVTKVCGKITRRCSLLRALASKEWGCERRTLMAIYHAMFRGVLNYCGPAWQPWLSRTGVGNLEVADNRALRAITGQLPTSPRDAIHAETGTPSYGRVVEYLAGRAWEKARRLPADHPRHLAAMNPVAHRGKLRDSWRELGKRVSSESGLGGSGVESLVRFGPPPWGVQTGGQRWSVQAVLDGGSTKESETEVLRLDAQQTIVGRGFGVVAYTDGSAEGGFRCGGSAAVITTGPPPSPVIIDTRRREGARYTSSFEAEVSALHLALDWMDAAPPGNPGMMVCTDSQALIRALQTPASSDSRLVGEVRERLDGMVSPLHIQWVPGHCGLVGNEIADVEANVAAGRGASVDFPNVTGLVSSTADGDISFGAASVALRESRLKVSPMHELVRDVYGVHCERPKPFGNRREAVLLAQLRTGHCSRLAGYARKLSREDEVDPVCPLCREEEQDVTHWLRRCPALSALRREVFECESPPMSSLVTSPGRVLAYAGRSLECL